MIRFETAPRIHTPAWSAHNLPKAKAPPMLGFSVLAVAAGLVVIVLATTLSGPIRTAGTKMEPARFQASAQNSTATIAAAKAMTPFTVASIAAGN